MLDKSNRHRVSPLLFHHLGSVEDAGRDAVPGEIFEGLRKSYVYSLMNNSRLMKRLEPLLEAFNDRGIPLFILKGPALCMTVYPDPGLRPFTDLDLLIRRQDLPAAKEIMPRLGYELVSGCYRNPDHLNEQLGCEWSYVNQGTVAEIHWDLLDKLAPYSIDIERFHRKAVKKKVGGKEVLIFSPENQLMHLCLHQYKHHWENLRELTDIHAVLVEYGDAMDWEQVLADSAVHGISRCVYYSLRLATDVLGAHAPPAFMADIRAQAGAGWWGERLTGIIEEDILADHLPRRLWKLILVNGYRDRLEVLREIMARPFASKGDSAKAAEVKSGALGKAKTLLKAGYKNRGVATDFLKGIFRR